MLWILLPFALAAGMYVYIRSRQRKLGVTAWHTKWKALPKERRTRILSAVKQGQALPDPEDAALAVEAIDATLTNPLRPRGRASRLLFNAGLPLVAVTLLLIAADGDLTQLVADAWPFLILLAIGPAIRLLTRGRLAALQRARDLNAQVAAAALREPA
jgi:hypothetical protein